MERTLGWMLNNKIIVLLSLLSFSLFVSTLALAGQKNGYQSDLRDCRNALHDATTTTVPPTTPAPATPPPTTTAKLEDVPNVPGDGTRTQNPLLKLMTADYY